MANGRGNSRENILYLLKTKGQMTAQGLADHLDITAVAVRQHIKRLSGDRLVKHRDERSGVGRPARLWSLTSRGNDQFPDDHGDLAVALLKSVRSVFGATGLEKLIAARTHEQAKHYRASIDDADGSIENRLTVLAEQRSAEGYMAEWHKDADGSYMLVENHCPVRMAAQYCQGLCRSELEVFQDILGSDVEVKRVSHLLDGAKRCAYRIGAPCSPASSD